MKITSPFNRLGPRLRSGIGKLRWGVRTVGWPATAAGGMRLVWLKLTQPATAEVRLRESGALVSFAYPRQLVPMLVVFGDVVDPEYAFLSAVAKEGWTFLDVGAAIGQFTVFAAVSTRGLVHAFEPSADNLATLLHNVERNGIGDRVTLHRLALSDHSGEARFTTAEVPFMSQIDADSSGPGDRVSVDTLASVVGRLGIDHVSVLKINVAGFEPAVIAGALPVLAHGFADVLILLIGRHCYDAYRDLEGLGYRFFFFHPRERRLHEVLRLDDEGLIRSRPWPARHVIGIWSGAIDRVVRGAVAIAPRS